MIDLRSDTVTTPCAAMRSAMAAAQVGDDVYGEDPTVAQLEARLAEMAGFEAGLFFPSGTQSNLVALLTHCRRGDEYIATQNAHAYRYEAGGGAVLGGIQPQPVEPDPTGLPDLAKAEAAIKADDYHFARTRLLTLENTIGGRVLPPRLVARGVALAGRHNLALHLDGARVFNAAIAQGEEVAVLTHGFDSVSICLSKGLGAPVGSVLCATADFIHRARRWRKITGGGMRQVGILAAAGLYALTHNIARLAQDHDRAATLAAALARVDEIEVLGGGAHTNMVFIKPRNTTATPPNPTLQDHAKTNGVLLANPTAGVTRLVTHLQVGDDDIKTAARVIGGFFSGN